MSNFLLWGVWVISSPRGLRTAHRKCLRESKTIQSSCYQMAKSDHLSSQHSLRAVACKILQKVSKKGHGHQLQKIRFWKFLSPKNKQMVPTQRGWQVRKWEWIHLLELGEMRRARELASGKDSLHRACSTATAPLEMILWIKGHAAYFHKMESCHIIIYIQNKVKYNALRLRSINLTALMFSWEQCTIILFIDHVV